jgi:hypothetical protein
MRWRFPLLEIILVAGAAFAAALLVLSEMPYRYGTAFDLIAGRRLDYRQLLGITFYAHEHQSILSRYYQKYVGSLPDETDWIVESSGVQLPRALQPLQARQPLPRYSPIRDAIIELNAILAQQETPGNSAARMLPEACAAAIEQTLAVARLSDNSELVFDYVRGLKQEIERSKGEIGANAFPTAAQFLSTAQAAD